MAKTAQASPASEMDAIAQIRKKAYEVENRACDIRTLIQAIFDKLDDMGNMDESQLEAHAAINCFATSVLHNIAILDEQYNEILLLTSSASSPASSEKGGV